MIWTTYGNYPHKKSSLLSMEERCTRLLGCGIVPLEELSPLYKMVVLNQVILNNMVVLCQPTRIPAAEADQDPYAMLPESHSFKLMD